MFYTQEEYAWQRGNRRRENAKSEMNELWKLFIGVKAFNEGGDGKTPLIPIGNLHTHGLNSRTARRFANCQAIITDECDSLAQRSF